VRRRSTSSRTAAASVMSAGLAPRGMPRGSAPGPTRSRPPWQAVDQDRRRRRSARAASGGWLALVPSMELAAPAPRPASPPRTLPSDQSRRCSAGRGGVGLLVRVRSNLFRDGKFFQAMPSTNLATTSPSARPLPPPAARRARHPRCCSLYLTVRAASRGLGAKPRLGAGGLRRPSRSEAGPVKWHLGPLELFFESSSCASSMCAG
jgi:hypothetical protein